MTTEIDPTVGTEREKMGFLDSLIFWALIFVAVSAIGVVFAVYSVP